MTNDKISINQQKPRKQHSPEFRNEAMKAHVSSSISSAMYSRIIKKSAIHSVMRLRQGRSEFISTLEDMHMNNTHCVPEIYNPDVPHAVKCEIVVQLCKALAVYRGIPFTALQNELKCRLNVDCQDLENNPVGMLLLYEYLYNLRPASCKCPSKGELH